MGLPSGSSKWYQGDRPWRQALLQAIVKRKFFFTEVFSESAYGGNQLATLPDAGGLSTVEMQKIARAFNFPETTFVTGGSLADGYDVRIFTPASEVPFAGHPTLGTGYLLRNVIDPHTISTITLNLGIGGIVVNFDDGDVLWMQQNQPEFSQAIAPEVVAQDLGLDRDLLDTRFPCQLVSTGLEFLIVPLRNYKALKQAVAPQSSQLATPYFLFCPGGYDSAQQIQARMFAVELGVTEDPATGSANGCLAAYLVEHQFFGSTKAALKVGQGYEINRPSQLYLFAEKKDGDFLIEVGGKVRLIAEGEWLL